MSALALVLWRRRSAPARDLPFWLSDHRSPDLPTTPGGGGLQASGNDYTYDAWGNLTNKTIKQNPTASCAGDLLNRADSATRSGTTTTYVYDADGNRVKKTNSGATTLYWYMTPGIIGESDATGTMKSEYVFFNGERVARRDNPGSPSATVAYYFSDHLKTASVITDAAGHITADSDYYPWGGELQFVNADSNHYKFTGKERDTETSLDYFGARYYSNGLGRFITPDWAAKPAAIPYAEFADPQSMNLYTYVRNVPTSQFDADGHVALVDDAVVLTTAFVAVALTVYLSQPSTQRNIVNATSTAVSTISSWLHRSPPPTTSTSVQAGAPASTSTNVQSSVPATTGTTVRTGAPGITSHAGAVNPNTAAVNKKDAAQVRTNAGGRCEYCGVTTVPTQQRKAGITPPANEGQTDHYIPQAEGGTDALSNLVHACAACNMEKSDTMPQGTKWELPRMQLKIQ